MALSLEESLGLPPPKMRQNATPKAEVTPKQLAILERQNRIVAAILQRKDITVIAKELGVDRATVYRNFEEWAKTEQAAHLQIEWLQQYEQMKLDDPFRAFEALTKLVMKLIEKQAKIEVNVNQQLVQSVNIDLAKMSENDRKAILAAEEALTRAETEPSQK
jgi:AcrR family transcriptional regulator